jgi:hypothetical protein
MGKFGGRRSARAIFKNKLALAWGKASPPEIFEEGPGGQESPQAWAKNSTLLGLTFL